MGSGTIRCFGSGADKGYCKTAGPFTIELKHIEGDPKAVLRLYVSREDFSVELIPSKGLSVRDVFYRDKPMFWNPPLSRLPDPAEINLDDPLLINGTKVDGVFWVACFAAHVEMLGLLNWGMPVEREGRLLPIHGNVSNIPVEELTLEVTSEKAVIEGSFYVYDAAGTRPPSGPEHIGALFKVTKRVEISAHEPSIFLLDSIENISGKPLFPDWGYHIQLRPEAGCRLLIPSRQTADRSKNPLPGDHEEWRPAGESGVRKEIGVIHKGLDLGNPFPDGSPGYESLLSYSDGTGILCILPPSPYTQSWYSCGGAGSDEFVIPGAGGGERIMVKNWDGVGPEIGASPLDHDGDSDPEIVQTELAPGEELRLPILLKFLSREEAAAVRERIEGFNKNRK